MGLRASLKKTFGGSSSSKKKMTPKKGMATLRPGEQLYTARTDIEYYKPNEIPRSKYKGKVDPLHAASLAAYSLSSAFGHGEPTIFGTRRKRRHSDGAMSPGGTKSQSRMTSAAASRAASRANSTRPSLDPGSRLKVETRAASLSSESSDSTASSRSLSGSSKGSGKEIVDTPSTSLSQVTNATPSLPELSINPTKSVPPPIDSGVDVATVHDTPTLTKQTTRHDTPFTVEELERAMSRVTLQRRDYDDEPAVPTRRMGIAS